MKFKSFLITSFLVSVLSCSSESQTQNPLINKTSDSSTAEVSIEESSDSVNSPNETPSLSVTIEPTPYSPIAASLDIESSLPVAVQITATSEEHQVNTARTSNFSSSHTFPLVGLRQSQSYDIEVLAIDESGEASTFDGGTFVSGEIDYPLPEFDLYIDLEQSQPGVTLIEYNPWESLEEYGTKMALIGIDNEGETVFFYDPGNTTIAAIQATPEGTFIAIDLQINGAREIDLLGNIMNQWRIPGLEGTDPLVENSVLVDPEWIELTTFHHEIFPLPNGNFLGLAATIHTLTPDQRTLLCPEDQNEFSIISDVVVEFEPDGTSIRSWDVWDALNIEETPGNQICITDPPFASPEIRDWTHANAVIYDETRDAILISSRHTNQVIAFDHLETTGPQSSIRWILGDQGTLTTEGDLFYHAHAVELQEDGSLLLYDNGNGRPGTKAGDPESPTYSRAVLYEISDSGEDRTQWEAIQRWEHRVNDIDENPLFASFLGDADRLENGNVLITHGGIWNRPATQRSRIIEVTSDNESGDSIVWDLALGDADVPVTVYRSERLPSLYFGPNWE
jgi:hypothetical protein